MRDLMRKVLSVINTIKETDKSRDTIAGYFQGLRFGGMVNFKNINKRIRFWCMF